MSSTEHAADACLTRSEVADLLGISVEAVGRLDRQGYLTVIKLPGCRPRYPRGAVEELLARSTRNPGTPAKAAV